MKFKWILISTAVSEDLFYTFHIANENKKNILCFKVIKLERFITLYKFNEPNLRKKN